MSNPNYEQFTKLHQFNKLKQTDPRIYWSPATQAVMHRIAMREGEAFFTEETTQSRNPSSGQFTRDTNTPTMTEREQDRAFILEALARLDRMKEIEENKNTNEETSTNAQ
jgi:hypothetical protein